MFGAPARTSRLLNKDTQKRLDDVRRQNPEAEPWLDMLEAALAESENTALWDTAVPEPVVDRPAGAPLLLRAHIVVDGPNARRWIGTLAGKSRVANPGDAVSFLESGIVQRNGGEVDADALRVVTQMAALPLLHACARVLGSRVDASWWEGYCPVCAGWPILAELRGLDRKRWLRCGRCTAAWEAPALRCPFCGEGHHERLGYLTPEGDRQTLTVEICHTCKGYLKAVTTVRTVPSWAVLLEDAASVPLDLVALERGYQRPTRAAYDVALRVTERVS